MRSLNKAFLIGRLGKDARLTISQKSGMPVAMLSVATSRYLKNKNDDKFTEETTWHNVIAFGETAKKIGTAKKGATIWVEGRIQNRSYEKEDKTTGYTSEIIAENISEFAPASKPESSHRGMMAARSK